MRGIVSNGTFCLLPLLCVAYIQSLPCGRDTFVTYEKQISWTPQADE